MSLRNAKIIYFSLVPRLFVFFLTVTFLFVPCGNIWATEKAGNSHSAKLEEGAKKERKLVWYTTLNLVMCNKLLKRFQEKYPYITPELNRLGDERMLIKVLNESRAKKHFADVQEMTGLGGEILRREKLFVKYLSPERVHYPDISKDSEGYWTDYYMGLNVTGYNTKLVSAKDAPKTYEDLLAPHWKGKIGMDTKAFEWFGHMLKVMGEENGLRYMKKLGDQNLKFYTGRTLVTQLMSAGEFSLGLALYNFRLEEMKQEGAPVEWIPMEPVVPSIHPLSVYANAPHPNAARLFIDFMLSREAQEMIAKDFRIPTRSDVDAIVPRLKKGFKILPFNTGITDDYARYVKLYRTVLMKK